jgi:tellurite resistance protein
MPEPPSPTPTPPAAAAHLWLGHVPVALFAAVMGITGLALVWRKANEVLGVGGAVGELLALIGALCFVGIAVLYAAKAMAHWPAVRSEFAHAVRANFFGTITVGVLLLAIAALPHARDAALVLTLAGAGCHFALTVALLARWIGHDHTIEQINPGLFIPIVGNILVPIAGVKLGLGELSWFFFAVGAVYWLAVLPIMLYRLFMVAALPPRLVPTLWILVAPPAVGYISYTSLVGGTLDPFARVLVYFALAQIVLLITMARRFLSLPFALSWWAYTFPLDAAAIAALDYGHRSTSATVTVVAALLAAAASIVVAIVAARTVLAMMRRTLFVPE